MSMNNCRVIAVANQKGGVGKSVSCVNLGIGLAKRGHKVLLIDADPQGSLSISLGYSEPDKMENTLAKLMTAIVEDETLNLEKAILHHEENVDFLKATKGIRFVPSCCGVKHFAEIMIRNLFS